MSRPHSDTVSDYLLIHAECISSFYFIYLFLFLLFLAQSNNDQLYEKLRCLLNKLEVWSVIFYNFSQLSLVDKSRWFSLQVQFECFLSTEWNSRNYRCSIALLAVLFPVPKKCFPLFFTALYPGLRKKKQKKKQNNKRQACESSSFCKQYNLSVKKIWCRDLLKREILNTIFLQDVHDHDTPQISLICTN